MSLLAYHRLKVAQDRFQCGYADLNAEQQQLVDDLAAKSLALEERVLGSSEAMACEVTTASLDEAVATLQARYESETAFLSALATQHLSRDALQKALQRELQFDTVMQRVTATLEPPSEAELQTYFAQNQQRLQQPEMRTARHILITVNNDYPENSTAAAKTRIEAIWKRLQRRPERFADEALKHSECPTALEGGNLGKVTAKALYPSLATALFSLNTDEMSGPIESPIGWHILQCTQIHSAITPTFDELKPALHRKLDAQKRHQHQRQWLAQLAN